MANKEIHCDCVIKLRENPKRRKDTVYVGCGAGFGGDRPLAALRLLQRVEEINYLVLECLAERTLADRWLSMSSGGDGYDPRVSEWMSLLLPLAVEKGTCIITNMGAIDPLGAQKKVLEVATHLGLTISVAVAHELHSEAESSWKSCGDIRLRMDGLFKLKEHAVQLTKEFTALYTNGPAGGGGISTGHKMEIVLEKRLVSRGSVMWKTGVEHTNTSESEATEYHFPVSREKMGTTSTDNQNILTKRGDQWTDLSGIHRSPAPFGQKIPLYSVAHSRAGDKGNDINFSLIPHYPPDIERLKLIITPQWVKNVMSVLLSTSSFKKMDAKVPVDGNVSVEIYDVKGIHALNVVVRNVLDGGVNCSRRIDRHGKTISDLILCQQVVL
ncbi:hypothetical protein F2Q68_00042904 [Brassica cretica]|uniref:Uncharacterized protein n=1 Tax=Brassica cretica TaxID=69181 RepID=A0A8S9MLT4_BRACR|nr:hypothetical protein F2Q68_00042904 [Brassica cretica]